MNDNPMVEVKMVMPLELASVFAAKPQFVWSERMQNNLMSILTDEQKAALNAAGCEARPLVFPQEVAQA